MLNFVSTVVIGFIFYLGMKYEVKVSEESRNSFNMIPYFILASIFPIFIGLLLRFPKLIIEIKEKKQWTFDWIKVAAIGIPSLYIALLPLLSVSIGVNLLFVKEVILLGNTTLTTTAGIVSGYVLLDSLKK